MVTEYYKINHSIFKVEKEYIDEAVDLRNSKVYRLIEGDWECIPRNEEGLKMIGPKEAAVLEEEGEEWQENEIE